MTIFLFYKLVRSWVRSVSYILTKTMQYKARICFNNRAISGSHYGPLDIKHGFH